MGWFSRTKKSPVMQPLQNGTANSSKTATGTLSTKNNFGETSQTLRKIQKTASPEIYLRSDKVTYSSDQYALIASTGESIMAVGNCIHNISREARQRDPNRRMPEEDIKTLFSREKNRIDNLPGKFSTVDIKDSLLEKDFKLINLSTQLLSSYDNIKKLTLSSEVGFFFCKDNFMYSTGHNFNDFCQKITDDDFFKALGTEDSYDKHDYLSYAGRVYAEKGILKNQLPKAEAKFKAIQKSGKASKDLLSIIEKIINHAKVGIRNMEHPERSAIFEQIAPVARPQCHSDFMGVLIKNEKLLNMSEKEVDAVYEKLRRIPFCLVP